MKNSFKIYLFILGLWLGLTCFLDFFAVPTVFRTLASRQDAGTLGMIFFHTFNKIEIVLALLLGLCGFFFKDDIKFKKTFFSTISGLLILVLVYTFHMTPQIIDVNKKKYNVMEGSEEYRVLEEKHLFYHGLFRKTDGLKILVLLTLFGTALKRKEV
jgi:hypothetical protein